MAFLLLAADSNSFLGITLGGGKGGSQAAIPMQITILLTLLALLPAAIMSVTPFLRISIVLHFLRQALGTQSTPSNQVLLGLSLFLTMLIVSPLFSPSVGRSGAEQVGVVRSAACNPRAFISFAKCWIAESKPGNDEREVLQKTTAMGLSLSGHITGETL